MTGDLNTSEFARFAIDPAMAAASPEIPGASVLHRYGRLAIVNAPAASPEAIVVASAAPPPGG